jgi:hypothetical protein
MDIKLVNDLQVLHTHRCVGETPKFQSEHSTTFAQLAQHVCKLDSDHSRRLSFYCTDGDAVAADVGNGVKATVTNWKVNLTHNTSNGPYEVGLSDLVKQIDGQLRTMNEQFKNLTELSLRAIAVTNKNERYALFTGRNKIFKYNIDVEIYKQSEQTWTRYSRNPVIEDVTRIFGTEYAKNAPLDVTSLQNLVASSLPAHEKHEHAALANIVRSETLGRYFSPEELIFFDVYSRAQTQLETFRRLYASYPPYWSSFARVDSGKCTPNQWTVHVGAPRGWKALFSDTLRKPVDAWNSFLVQKARHDALTFYELLRLKLETQPSLETSEWVLLYSIKLVLEWAGQLLQRVLAAFYWLDSKTSAGTKAKSLLGWMTTTFSMVLSSTNFPDVVLVPLGYGAAFIGNAGALVGAVPIVLWKQRHELYKKYKTEVQYISNQLAPKKQPPPSTEPPKTPIEMLWDIVQTEFKLKGKKDMSSRGYYALQEACELAKNTTTTPNTISTPTPTTNLPTSKIKDAKKKNGNIAVLY